MTQLMARMTVLSGQHLLAHLEVCRGSQLHRLEFSQLLWWGFKLQHCYVLVWVATNDLHTPQIFEVLNIQTCKTTHWQIA